MDNSKKVIDMEQAVEAEVTIETKPSAKDKVKAWWGRNKKKILIGVGAVLAVGGAAAVKTIKDRKEDAYAQAEAERQELAEEWYQRGLEEARTAPALPDAVDVDYTPVETVE